EKLWGGRRYRVRMLFFFVMESSAFAKNLTELGRVADSVRKQRGEHAAALWVVNEFLSDLGDGLTEFRCALDDDHFLAVARLKPARRSATCRRLFGAGDDVRGPWGLCIERGGERQSAVDADPVLTVEILKVLPTFLEGLRTRLSSTSSQEATTTAKSLVDTVFQLDLSPEVAENELGIRA
ncbi:MAG: hypothetical protein AAF488_17140, partial [Planctomycetota bacterium]